MSEIIELTETTRLRVEYDDNPSNPRTDWDMLTGFVKIEGRGDSRRIDVAPVHDSPIPIAEAWDRLAYLVQSRYTPDEAHVERWARIFHDMHIEYDSEHGGFWFVAPDTAAIVFEESSISLQKQAEIIESERESYRQWAEGEVYGVILERLEVWQRVTEPDAGERREEWEEADSLWGCYLDDDYTAQMVAEAHFDLSDEESAALGLSDITERRETPAEAATGASGEW